MALDPAGQNQLEDRLQELQPLHQQMRHEFVRSLLLSGILGCGALYFLSAVLNQSWLEAMVCSLLIAGVTQRLIYAYALGHYRKEFKTRVVPELVRACKPAHSRKVRYAARNGITEQEFEKSRLFRAPDIFTAEDLITGTIGETRIRFSLAEAQVVNPTVTGRTMMTRHGTIFKGLFFIADFNKAFAGTTVVGTDTTEELLGRFGRVLERTEKLFTPQPSNQVHLEDPEFERLFNAYSTDQVEARYLLTPAFMQRLSTLRSRYGSDIYLAFSAGQMILAMPLRHGWLEPPPFYKPLNSENLQPCINQLQLAFGLVEELNLSTRIWSK